MHVLYNVSDSDNKEQTIHFWYMYLIFDPCTTHAPNLCRAYCTHIAEAFVDMEQIRINQQSSTVRTKTIELINYLMYVFDISIFSRSGRLAHAKSTMTHVLSSVLPLDRARATIDSAARVRPSSLRSALATISPIV